MNPSSLAVASLLSALRAGGIAEMLETVAVDQEVTNLVRTRNDENNTRKAPDSKGTINQTRNKTRKRKNQSNDNQKNIKANTRISRIHFVLRPVLSHPPAPRQAVKQLEAPTLPTYFGSHTESYLWCFKCFQMVLKWPPWSNAWWTCTEIGTTLSGPWCIGLDAPDNMPLRPNSTV